MFDPFEQLEGPLTRHIDAAGLGLSIAKALMALYGGELAIDSECGHGTSVELRLPGERIRPPLAAVAD
jgi:signal transduction histidine kinase